MSAEERPQRLARTFAEYFGTAPASVWHVPELASLLGEHTAPSDGLALPIALPWGPSAALDVTEDGILDIHVSGEPHQRVHRPVAEVTTSAATGLGWAAPVGTAVQLMAASGHLPDPAPGIRVCLDRMPAPGTAAATAAECAVLLALAETLGHNELVAQPRALAEIADGVPPQASEPCGMLTRSAVLRCRAEHALLLDCHSHNGRGVTLPLREHELCLLVVDTKAGTDTVPPGAVPDWRAECVRSAQLAGVSSLRTVAEEMELGEVLRTVSEETARRRIQHVVTEIHRVNAANGLLRMGAVAELGALLNTGHLSLRDQLECTLAEVDLAVETAVRSGARGARLTGEPTEGRVLALAPVEQTAAIRAGLDTAFSTKGWPAPQVRVVTAAGPGPSRPL